MTDEQVVAVMAALVVASEGSARALVRMAKKEGTTPEQEAAAIAQDLFDAVVAERHRRGMDIS